jgi:predicted dehydrogenase
MVRVAVAGAGRVAAEVHLPNLAGLREARVTAIADPDPARRMRAGALARGARMVADYRELAELSDVDAVLVCLPTPLHAPAAIAALEAGRHVYVEKPLAACVERAAPVVEAWRRSGRAGMIGFNYRHNPLYASLKTRLDARAIGTPIAVRTVFSTRRHDGPRWEAARESGGGALLRLGCHHIDLIAFLLDRRVTRVSAEIRSIESEHDTACLQLVLDGGTVAQAVFANGATEEDRVEVHGERGVLAVDRYRSLDAAFRGAVPRRGQEIAGALRRGLRVGHLVEKWRSPWNEPSHRRALAHFLRAIAAGTPVSPDLLDGERTLEVIAAAERSAATGQAVAVPGGHAATRVANLR